MSAPAQKASSPAPWITTQRSDVSAEKLSIASASAIHMARSKALRFSGRAMVTVAMVSARVTWIKAWGI